MNSIDREHDREWLPEWLEEHGLPPSDFDRAVALREALRALLRVNNVALPKEIQACRDYLRPALWTTLEPKGTDLLLDALQSGRLRF